MSEFRKAAKNKKVVSSDDENKAVSSGDDDEKDDDYDEAEKSNDSDVIVLPAKDRKVSCDLLDEDGRFYWEDVWKRI